MGKAVGRPPYIPRRWEPFQSSLALPPLSNCVGQKADDFKIPIDPQAARAQQRGMCLNFNTMPASQTQESAQKHHVENV